MVCNNNLFSKNILTGYLVIIWASFKKYIYTFGIFQSNSPLRYNEFTQWHPDEWGNITWLKIKPQQLWTPDIIPYNDMDDSTADVADKYKKLILLDHTGDLIQSTLFL